VTHVFKGMAAMRTDTAPTCDWFASVVLFAPIRTSLRRCRSLFPGNGICAGQRQRRRKGPSHSTYRQQRQSTRTKTHQFGAICTTPGNLCLYRTAWWGSEDSNCQPNDYQPLVSGQSRHTAEITRCPALASFESGQFWTDSLAVGRHDTHFKK
jgi:hypothetical protein